MTFERYSFVTPRQADSGLYYVRVFVASQDGEIAEDILRDEYAHMRLFADRADAITAGVQWKRRMTEGKDHA